jgi:hypothetical protein
MSPRLLDVLKHPNDVRIIKLDQQPRLIPEPLEERLVIDQRSGQVLDGNMLAGSGVHCLDHAAGRTGPELTHLRIAWNCPTAHERGPAFPNFGIGPSSPRFGRTHGTSAETAVRRLFCGSGLQSNIRSFTHCGLAC